MMKVNVMVLEIYRNGKLDDVRVLGDEDDYEKEVCVTYEDITDIAELKEAIKGWAESTRHKYLGMAVDTGRLTIQMGAAYLPKKIGTTSVRTVTKEIEWPEG